MESIETPKSNEISDKNIMLEACKRGDLKYLGKFILDGGDLITMIDDMGQTPLHYCVKQTNEANNKNINNPTNFQLDKDSLSDQYDRLKCARVIIKTNTEFLTYHNFDGYTPLHLAVVNDDLEFIKLLFEFNMDMSIQTDTSITKTKQTDYKNQLQRNQEPHKTEQGKQHEEHKQTDNDSSRFSNNGRTILHLATIHMRLNILEYLLNSNYVKNFINQTDNQGATALHYAVQLNNEFINPILNLLINNGQANLNSQDMHGRTPLIWASTIGSKYAVELLLKFGASFNQKDKHGLTALHCAASRGHLDIIQSILQWIELANLDDLSKITQFRDVNDNDGCSPLFYSVTMGHIKVTKALIKAKSNVMHCDYKGRTVCHCLARLTNDDNPEKTCKVIRKQLKYLIKAGLNPWQPNNNGATALHEACLLKNLYFVKQLTDLPGFMEVINQTESQGHTPLHLVVAASWSTDEIGLELCEFLLKNNANIDAITKLPKGDYVTALDLANLNETKDKHAKQKLIDLLVKYNAHVYQDLNDQDKITKASLTNELIDQSSIHTDGCISSGNESTISNKNELIQNLNQPTDQPDNTTEFQNSKLIQTLTDVDSNKEFRDCGVQTIKNAKQKLDHKYFVQQTQTEKSIESINSDINSTKSNKEKCSKQIIVRMPTPVDGHNKIYEDVCVGCDDFKPLTIQSCSERKTSRDIMKNNNDNNNNKMKNNSTQVTKNLTKKKLPYPQSYIERELPVLLRKYLEKENDHYCPLTGRYSMPKSQLSPYLQPVVPGLISSKNYLVYSNKRFLKNNNKSINNSQNTSNSNSSKIRHREQSDLELLSQLSLSKNENNKKHISDKQHIYPTNTNIRIPNASHQRVQQSVADYEFYRLINELFKQKGLNQTNNLNKPIIKKKRPKSTPGDQIRKSEITHQSAMGGDLSSLDNSMHSDEEPESYSQDQQTHTKFQKKKCLTKK